MALTTLSFLAVSLLSLAGCVWQDAAQHTRQRQDELREQYATQPHHFARYHIVLAGVERSKQATDQYGEVVTHTVKTASGYTHHAEDQLIRIVWSPPFKEFPFEILNKSEYPVRILWDEAAYVDAANQTHRVMHSGIKFNHRNLSQSPSVVAAGGRLIDLLAPVDYAWFTEGSSGGWNQRNIFECVKGYICNEEQQRIALAHRGLAYRILLPLQVGSDTQIYTFIFNVSEVEILKQEPAANVSEAQQ